MYRQITADERYTLGTLHQLGYAVAVIAQVLGRHRSTVFRELRRNATRYDASYRPQLADWYARGRRRETRRGPRFTAQDYALVRRGLARQWSPAQIAGRLRLEDRLRISHETIYRYIWADKRQGGALYRELRGGRRHCRKRYGRPDSRGRLLGKRPITARPGIVERRARIGDWEGDTVVGPAGTRPCLLSLVERKTGFLVLGKLGARTAAEVNRCAALEAGTRTRVYFATPHHAWARGTNENTNGLIRQYVPKGQSMAALSDYACTTIATTLNQRPRKRLGFRTPEECYVP
ncbi:MAG: IS30 family transposase [Gemmatimonadales bacterium]|jgi:IS30 family transposase|nr:MAG: IS30 family transposase [Gemmatimonadales bacterium]